MFRVFALAGPIARTGRRYGLAAVLLAALAGCGAPSAAPVTGTVTLDGKALSGAAVMFRPEGATEGLGGSGTTDAGIGGVSISSDSTINLNAGSNNTAYRGQSFNGILFYQDPRATVGTMSTTSKIFTVTPPSTVGV